VEELLVIEPVPPPLDDVLLGAPPVPPVAFDDEAPEGPLAFSPPAPSVSSSSSTLPWAHATRSAGKARTARKARAREEATVHLVHRPI